MTARQYHRVQRQLTKEFEAWDDNRIKYREICVTWRLPEATPPELAGDYILWQTFAACCLLWRMDMPRELLLYLREVGEFRRRLRLSMRIPRERLTWNRTGYYKFCTRAGAELEEVRQDYVVNELVRKAELNIDIWNAEWKAWESNLLPDYMGSPYVEVKEVKVL